jgi:glycosyltransferase involved in cell wall biosynthesis
MRYLTKGQRVLNIGLGGGLFERFCCQKGVNVYSIDPDWLSLHNHPATKALRLTAAKIEDLPFKRDVFDAVVVSEVIEHLTPDSTRRALQEINRILTVRGRLLGTVPCEENLTDGVVVCPGCGEVFHKVGHLQSFSVATMTALLQSVFPHANCFERAFMAKATVGRKEFLIGLIRNQLVRSGLLTREKHLVFLGKKAPPQHFRRRLFSGSRFSANRRIALFMPSLAGGGAERRILNLASEFSRQRYRVDIVVAKAEGAYLNRVPEDVRLVDLRATRPFTSIPALVRYLSSEQPGALLATITSANLAALWALQLAPSKTRCVVCEASSLSNELRHTFAHNRLLTPLLIRRFFPKAHAIVAVSEGVADDLSRVTRIPRRMIRVIYNPVVSPDSVARSAEKPSHPWLSNGAIPVIVGVGRLTRQKNFETLIHAFSEVRNRIPSKLVILGDGEDRPHLEKLIGELAIHEHVDLHGFVDNPYPFLSRASLFVLSSQWEGLPWVLIEALACGTKVVSTDCPSGPREILADGVFGQLCPVGDVAAMAAAMINALTGGFVARDPAKWLDRFSLQANAERYLDLLIG